MLKSDPQLDLATSNLFSPKPSSKIASARLPRWNADLRRMTGVSQFLFVTACLIVAAAFGLQLRAAINGRRCGGNGRYRERASIVSFRLSLQSAGTLCGVVLGLGVFAVRSKRNPGARELRAVCVDLRGSHRANRFDCHPGRVRGALPRLRGPRPEESHLVSGFLRELIDLLRNRSFLLLFGTVLVYFLAYSVSLSLALHTNRYFWKLDPLRSS